MSRSRENQGRFSRNGGKPNTRAAAGPSAEKLDQLRKKVPKNQADAIQGLELGRSDSGNGLEFKEHGSQPDAPIVERRPDMPNESGRNDQDRRGGRKKN